MEVTEFIPYVFQVLAQLLEYSAGDLSSAYESLFAPLLTPTLWESKGNIPGLTRLICAYMGKAGKKLCIQGNFLMGVLGVFQKLISSKANESYGFQLLGALVESLGMEGLQNHIIEVFNILLMRLQKGKTARYVRHICLFFSFLICKCGAATWLQILNSIQPGLGGMLLQQVWIPCVLNESIFNKSDNKVMVVGMAMLMKEADIINLDGGKPWTQLVAGVLKLVGSGVADDDSKGGDDGDLEIEISFDSSFSKLNFAGKPVSDRLPEVPDKEALLAKNLGECCATKPETLVGLLQVTFQDKSVVEACGEVKVGEILQQLIQKYHVNLC
jgi:exportin-2 (importin alpha re-exporter)